MTNQFSARKNVDDTSIAVIYYGHRVDETHRHPQINKESRLPSQSHGTLYKEEVNSTASPIN